MITSSRRQRRKERKRLVVALLISLIVHLFLIGAAIFIISLNPSAFFPDEPEPEPIEVTIIPPEPDERGWVDSSQNILTEEDPTDARLESDQSSIAAATEDAVDDSERPTLAGDEGESLAMIDQEFTLGPVQQQASEASPPSPTTAQQDAPETREQQEPEPTESAEQSEVPADQQEPQEQTEEEPEPTPTPAPPPELALLDPTLSKPAPRPEPQVRRAEVARPPQPQQPPGYQPERRVTRLTGGISNKRDRASLAAQATPLGRYNKMLSDAIGSRWYYHIRSVMDLVNIGTVQLRFVVRQDGTVEGVRVLSNSSNESLASCSVRSVIEAEIPPIPEDVARELEGNRLEIDYSFSITPR